MFVQKLVLAAVLATSAYAQSSEPTETSSGPVPTSSSQISPCLLTCLTSATQCPDYTDPTCVCSNLDFQSAVTTCLQQSCTAADLAEAQALQQNLCGSSSSSVVSSVLSSLSSRASSASGALSSLSSKISSVSSSRASGTASPTSSSGSGGAAGLSTSFLATGGAVLLGVIGGGLLVF